MFTLHGSHLQLFLSFRQDQVPKTLFMQSHVVIRNNLVQDGEYVDLVALSTHVIQEILSLCNRRVI